ncbi:rhamnan synthesis F family protein [Succinivibrio dextrinosolvens]|uniref:rhamnan synthesis F family protein n=1 Tax=Succinivibrio dextrinosolvens TaxID=83771 RepID=UPI0015A5022B|nr:rhamnan synthesis F family protein [Succinivibrio dextrinosolvens]
MSEKILVIVHVFYPELWDELAGCISNLDKINKNYDLYVTMPESLYNQGFSEHIYKVNEKANVSVSENVGYDIWPFLKILKQVDLDKYDYIIKLHTKRSMGSTVVSIRDKFFFMGSSWRNYLLSFIKDKPNLESVFAAFKNDSKLGMVSNHKLIDITKLPCKDEHFAFCAENAISVINKVVSFDANSIEFVGGSMFICRSKLFKKLVELDYNAVDFMQAKRDHIDDLPHILERVFGGLVTAQGYRIDDPFTKSFDRLLNVPYSYFCRFLSLRLVKKITRFIFRVDGLYNEDKIIRVFKIKLFTVKRKQFKG